jgi:hypothetical protein
VTDMKQHFGVLSHFKAVVKPPSILERSGCDEAQPPALTVNGSLGPLKTGRSLVVTGRSSVASEDCEAIKVATMQVRFRDANFGRGQPNFLIFSRIGRVSFKTQIVLAL